MRLEAKNIETATAALGDAAHHGRKGMLATLKRLILSFTFLYKQKRVCLLLWYPSTISTAAVLTLKFRFKPDFFGYLSQPGA